MMPEAIRRFASFAARTLAVYACIFLALAVCRAGSTSGSLVQVSPETSVASDLQPCINDLQSTDPKRVMNAAEALGKLGTKAAPAVPALVQVLKHGDLPREVSMHVIRPSPPLSAATALTQIGPSSAEALKAALDQDSEALHLNVAWVLSKWGADRNLDAFLRLAGDPSPRVRSFAVEVLGGSTQQPAVNARLAACSDPDPQVRACAVSTFSHPNLFEPASKTAPDDALTTRIVNAVVPRLRDSDLNTRLEAIDVLTQVHSPEAVQPLMEALSKAEDIEKLPIGVALAGQHDPRATDSLLRLLEETKNHRSAAQDEFVNALRALNDPRINAALAHPGKATKRNNSRP